MKNFLSKKCSCYIMYSSSAWRTESIFLSIMYKTFFSMSFYTLPVSTVLPLLINLALP